MSRPKGKRIVENHEQLRVPTTKDPITRDIIENHDFIRCHLCGGSVPPWRVREILAKQIKFPELKGRRCPICRK